MKERKFKVNKTTLSIYRAVFELLELHIFDEITVNDICKTAMVSRSTFYSYFRDKYELIVFCLEEERRQIGNLNDDNILNNIKNFLNRFKKRQSIYINLILSQSNKELNKMLMGHFHGYIKKKLSGAIVDEEKLEVLSIVYTTGISGSILWWIENNFPIGIDNFANYQYEIIEEFLEKNKIKETN